MSAPRRMEIGATLAARFWSKVAKKDETSCWLWTGVTRRGGYGAIGAGGDKGRTLVAHRVSWALTNGPVPAGLLVLHHCDVPSCVNPTHLYVGTQVDNMRDRTERGRDPKVAAKISRETADKIRAEYVFGKGGGQGGPHSGSAPSLSKKYGLDASTVLRIVAGKLWK